MKSDIELKQLALDIRSGHVFTDGMLERKCDISLHFGSLMFLDRASHERLRADVKSGAVAMLYEYIYRSGQFRIGGRPVFLSFNTLSRAEAARLDQIMGEIDAALATVGGAA